MMRILAHTCMAGACCLAACGVVQAAEPGARRWRFAAGLDSDDGVAPLIAEGVEFRDGAVHIDRPARLAYPTAGLNPNAFTIRFRVKHELALADYFYRRLVYIHHETADMKNRIGIQKRAGSNSLVFFLSNGQGRAKGKHFGGDWFALSTGPLEWEPDSWHEVVCSADREAGKAQLRVDGVTVAEAHGTEFPEALGEVFWVGSEQGHSWMRGAIAELRLEPVASFADDPVVAAGAPRPIPPAARFAGGSVGELTGRELTANLDFFDVCIGVDTWDLRHCDAEMDRLMALCAHYGHDRVFFRVSVCGAVCYHTTVMQPADERAFTAYVGKDMLDRGCGNIPSEIPRMAAVMQQIDPLESGARHARRHGLSCYAWVTSFDSLYYATGEEFFQRNPQYTWVSRDGTSHIPGVPCYAYPEVRAYRLAQVRELCAYDIDGILFSPRSHSPWPGRRSGGGNEGSRGYGFNEPVIQAYVQRYGKDPRASEPDSLDELRFVQLKAEFYTQFLREAREILHAAGKKLVLMTSAAIADPLRAAWMLVDAETIVREGIADELCLMGSPGDDLNRWRLLGNDRVKVSTWGSIHGTDYDECLGRMQTGLRAMLENPTTAGSTFHELANLLYPDCWEEAIFTTIEAWGAKQDAP